MYWFGSKARLAISDPDMIKEILVSKSGSFGKIRYNPISKTLFGEGLVGQEGEKWVVHRRIANYAFKMERVKVQMIIELFFDIYFVQFFSFYIIQ